MIPRTQLGGVKKSMTQIMMGHLQTLLGEGVRPETQLRAADERRSPLPDAASPCTPRTPAHSPLIRPASPQHTITGEVEVDTAAQPSHSSSASLQRSKVSHAEAQPTTVSPFSTAATRIEMKVHEAAAQLRAVHAADSSAPVAELPASVADTLGPSASLDDAVSDASVPTATAAASKAWPKAFGAVNVGAAVLSRYSVAAEAARTTTAAQSNQPAASQSQAPSEYPLPLVSSSEASDAIIPPGKPQEQTPDQEKRSVGGAGDAIGAGIGAGVEGSQSGSEPEEWEEDSGARNYCDVLVGMLQVSHPPPSSLLPGFRSVSPQQCHAVLRHPASQ